MLLYYAIITSEVWKYVFKWWRLSSLDDSANSSWAAPSNTPCWNIAQGCILDRYSLFVLLNLKKGLFLIGILIVYIFFGSWTPAVLLNDVIFLRFSRANIRLPGKWVCNLIISAPPGTYSRIFRFLLRLLKIVYLFCSVQPTSTVQLTWDSPHFT